MTMQSSKILTLAAVTCVAASAAAAPAHNVCVPMASGVPTMAGPPKWQSWGGTAPVSAALDDPRWLGATGQSFELGSAKAPLHTRAVWATEGGQTFLYLSFIVDVEGMLGATASSPRDLFVGFRRPAPVGGEAAYIFQFHLDGTAAAGHLRGRLVPERGARLDAGGQRLPRRGGHREAHLHCPAVLQRERLAGAELPVAHGVGHPGDRRICRGGAHQAREALPGAPGGGAGGGGALIDEHAPVVLRRGAVLCAVRVAPAVRGRHQAGGGGGPYVNLGHWPRELTTPICPNTSLADFLIHQELGDPDKYSSLTTFSGARPATCDKGLRISTPQIGAVFDAPLATDLSTVALNTIFKALKPDGTPGVNTVVAQVENTGATAVTAPLLARFRLAGWGAAPWSTTDPGKWKDMRKAKDGVCGAGTSPSCTPTTIAAGGKGAISFRWQLGDDPTLGASEYCQFGLTPPAGQGVCQVCSCAGSATCDAPTDPGTQSTRPGVGLWPCVSSNYHHQCMLVELSAPNGGVDFEQQSSWNNMNFGQMSVMEREALIDARGLPVAPGQKEQDIYLIAMPRVMPDKLATTSTGNELVGRRAFEAARRVIDPYRESVAQLPEEERRRLAERMKRRIPTPDDLKEDRRMRYFGEAYLALQQVRALVSPDDYQRSGRLLDLAGRAMDGQVTAEQVTHDVVDLVGPSAAAEIVPTLEIYAFYQHLGKGAVYQPMTSFSVFLSHQGPLEGITWELDGAERVGHNIYHLRIPVGFARRVQVRSQALEPGELVQAPGSKSWPCGGGCCCRDRGLLAGLGNTMPTMLGLALVGGGRRRRKAAKASKASKSA